MGTLAIAIIALAAFMFCLGAVQHGAEQRGEDMTQINRIGAQCGSAFFTLSIILCFVVIL